MDANILKYIALIKTVQYGSFTKAAEKLNYSQSSISRMVADLEKEWGINLLERSRNGVQLTSEGHSLLPHIQNLCVQYNNLQNHIDQIHGLQSGIIRIGTFSSITTHWLPAVIRDFKRDYPGIDYELATGEYGQIENWIVEGSVDLGFVLLPVHSDLELIRVIQDELLAILPENHPLNGYSAIPISAFGDYAFILRESSEKAEISRMFDSAGVRPKTQFTTYDDYAIMSMVENGLGISILPRLILNRTPYHIVTRPLEIPAYRSIGMALKSSKNAPLVVKRFLDYTKDRQIITD